MSEFERRVELDSLTSAPSVREISAKPDERTALAARFQMRSLDALEATLELRRIADGAELGGRWRAKGVQACVVSGADVPVSLDEPIALRFSRHAEPSGEERELLPSDLDVLPADGGAIDIGEAVAQSLGIALDPYPRASGAEIEAARLKLISEEEAAEALARERARNNPFRVIDGGR